MSKRVAIVGGGIIGLFSAYYLQKAGHEVTVIDKGDLSSGASFINAGLITPSHFIPLAAPGIINKGLSMMFDATGPLRIAPRLDIDFLKWLWAFKKSATKAKVLRAKPVLKDVHFLSRELFREFERSNHFQFQFDQKGILLCYQTDKAGEEELKISQQAKALGYEVKHYSREELKEIEPDVELAINGAYYYHCDAHMTPGEFMTDLHSYLKQVGVKFYTGEEVVDFEMSSDKILKIRTSHQEHRFDELILAAGAWTSSMLKKLNIGLLLEAGKGYRIDIEEPSKMSRPAILLEEKIAVTPMNGFTRLAGTMDFGGLNSPINYNRAKSIAIGAKQYFPNWQFKEEVHLKAATGLRPCSPDGLPYIGRSNRYRNLTIATGHAMIGWSLGPATGLIISEIIADRKPSVNLDLFNPNRKF